MSNKSITDLYSANPQTSLPSMALFEVAGNFGTGLVVSGAITFSDLALAIYDPNAVNITNGSAVLSNLTTGNAQITGGAITGTPISGSTVSGTTLRTDAASDEQGLVNTWGGNNVGYVWNKDSGGFSALRYLDTDGKEKCAVGYAKSALGVGFDDCFYIESSNYLLGPVNNPSQTTDETRPVIPIRFFTTGTIGGNFGFYNRAGFEPDGKFNINSLELDGTQNNSSPIVPLWTFDPISKHTTLPGNLNFSAGDLNLAGSSGLYFGTRAAVYAPATGVVVLSNLSFTGSPIVVFGGTNSSSFPALKNNGPALEVRMADDSGTGTIITKLPTSNPGPGILWNNAGTPAIGT